MKVFSPDSKLINPETGKYEWTPEACANAWRSELAALDEWAATAASPILVVMRGVPGSGKSTVVDAISGECSYMDEDHNVAIFDATNVRRSNVDSLIQRVSEARGTDDYGVVVLQPNASAAEARRRNMKRSEDRKVPRKTFSNMCEEFEPYAVNDCKKLIDVESYIVTPEDAVEIIREILIEKAEKDAAE